MKKITKKIIRKLGGIVLEDLPVELQKEILLFYVRRSIEKDLSNRFFFGFNTTYTKDETVNN